MAQQITLAQAQEQFPGAVEAIDPEDLQFYSPDAEDRSEFWTHNGTLYSRSWWTGYGWHYGIWQDASWRCPDTGEVICPWTGTRS